jgi:hypothetical protein
MTDPMSAFRIAAFAAFACGKIMGEQARYVMRELGNVTVNSEQRRALEKTCRALEANAWDIPTELDELAALALPDDAVAVRKRVDRIHAWLRESLPDLQRIVRALDDAATTQPRCGSAFLLVAESATAVLNAFAEVDHAWAQYLARVEASG